MRKTNLDLLRGIRFFTLGGVREARVEGEQIVGRWQGKVEWLYDRKGEQLAKAFANWKDIPAEIAVFTRRFGPLLNRATDESPFRFSVQEWRERQNSFRTMWEAWAGIPTGTERQTTLVVESGEQLIHRKTGMYYRTSNLHRLMLFSLAAIPTIRLRKCPRPGCASPYFLARHLNQSYCSKLCADWAQKQWKKEWWEHNKKAELKKRKRLRRKKGR